MSQDDRCPKCGANGHMPRCSSISMYDCGSSDGQGGFVQSEVCYDQMVGDAEGLVWGAWPVWPAGEDE